VSHGPRAPAARQHRRAGANDRDAGAVTAQLVIATPLLLFLLLLIVQFAVWFLAIHAAQATAAQALSAARAEHGSAAAGRAQADTILAQLGTGLLIDPQVNVTRAGGQVRAQITGTVQAIVPGMHLPVEAIAAGPTDAWTTP
jgi:Flp pilus assembly protein TadG